MNYLIITIVTIGFVAIIWKFLDYRKRVQEVRNQPGSGYGKRMGVFYLLSAFIVMFGFGAILEQYLVRALHLKSSPNAEKYMLIAFIVLTVGAIFILSDIKISNFRFFNQNKIKFKGNNNDVKQDVKDNDF